VVAATLFFSGPSLLPDKRGRMLYGYIIFLCALAVAGLVSCYVDLRGTAARESCTVCNTGIAERDTQGRWEGLTDLQISEFCQLSIAELAPWSDGNGRTSCKGCSAQVGASSEITYSRHCNQHMKALYCCLLLRCNAG
jgi:hypothetical protein